MALVNVELEPDFLTRKGTKDTKRLLRTSTFVLLVYFVVTDCL